MNNLRGAVLMIFSMAIFAVEDMLIKQASTHLPVGEILMILGLFAALVFASLAAIRSQRLFPRDLLNPVILLRNISEVVGTFGIVTALSLVDLSTASAILQALPLVVTLIAALFLGETVGWRRWSAIGVGFLGMLLIIRPGTAGFEPEALFAVLGVLGLSLRDLTTRIAPPSMSSIQLAQWGYITLFLLGLGMTVAGEGIQPVSVPVFWLLTGIVVAGVLGYYLIVESLRISALSAIAPFRYSRLVFAMALAVVFLGERPDLLTLAGTSLIICSGLYTLARERALFSRAHQG